MAGAGATPTSSARQKVSDSAVPASSPPYEDGSPSPSTSKIRPIRSVPIVIVIGLLASCILFREILGLELQAAEPARPSGIQAWHLPAVVVLVVGIALTAAGAFCIAAEQRRSARLQGMVESVSLEAAQRSENEERSRLIIQCAPEGIFTINRDGVLTSVNPAFEEAIGRTRIALLGKPLLELVCPDDASKVRGLIQGAVLGNRASAVEIRVQRNGQQPLLVDVMVTPETERKRTGGLLGIGRDVTARRKAGQANVSLQAELREARRLEALGKLAGSVAHDFNSFLTTIMANCQIARMDLVHGHPAIESVDQISSASDQAAALVRQILAFIRNESQERQLLNLEAVVSDAIRLFGPTLPANIQIETRFAPDCPTVLANPGQIHQAVLNLGNNAAHAMVGRGGRLAFAVESTAVDERFAALNPGLRPGHYVRLTAEDTGHGMDASTLAHIFDPFFTTKPKGEGTGLGLFIVQNIMRNHDGTVLVQSEPNRGTVFHLYFPAAQSTENLLQGDIAALPKGGGHRVLLIEADESLAEGERNLLERLGYRASICSSPADALALFRAAPDRFDCVLCDLALPGLNGVELAAECRQCKPDAPFILMGAEARAFSPEPLRALGIHDFIVKPLPPGRLAESLHLALNRVKG